MIIDPEVLPEGLPEPEDDGAASHLVGRPMPVLALPSTSEGRVRVDLVPEGADRLVLYAYPRTGPTSHARLGSHSRRPRLYAGVLRLPRSCSGAVGCGRGRGRCLDAVDGRPA
jgi:hypothetical protein